MVVVSEVWSKLKNAVLNPGGVDVGAVAVALIRTWMILPVGAKLVKPTPVNVTD